MSFPDCNLIDVDQRAPEWFAARKGRLTASRFGAWLTDYKPKLKVTIEEMKDYLDSAEISHKGCKTKDQYAALLPDLNVFMALSESYQSARITASSLILAEVAGFPDPAVFENADIKRGIEWEQQAIQEFSKMTGLAVDSIGFAQSKHGLFGASPDGLILSTGHGLEIKCPRASKLIQYVQRGELPDEYRDQVHGSMAVTGAKGWHFYAYHEGLPSFHKFVERNDYTEEMLEGLKVFSEHLRGASIKLQFIATQQFQRLSGGDL